MSNTIVFSSKQFLDRDIIVTSTFLLDKKDMDFIDKACTGKKSFIYLHGNKYKIRDFLSKQPIEDGLWIVKLELLQVI